MTQVATRLMINLDINHYLTHHESVLKELVCSAEIPATALKEAMLYTLFPGGKRLRPVLVYLCGEILNISLPALDLIAAAIEITHCYSLVHDDLPAMDNDDLRRGKPSCHKAYGEATAILVGDGLQALAIELLLEKLPKYLNPSQVIKVTQELVKASGPAGMVSGQSLDLSELIKPEISEAELRQIHSLKTGKLILACIKMVLAAGNPTEQAANNLTDYARLLGLVFQMQDDYLDCYAKPEVLGKGRSSDLANQKITFASLYKEKALAALIDNYFETAKEKLVPFSEKAANLLALTNYLHQRGNI